MIELTKRQREVLELLAEGMGSKEIAVRLSLGTRTIETYRAQLHRRAGVAGAVSLLRVFYEFVPRPDVSIGARKG